MTQDTLTISPGSRFRAAMMVAVVADALQIVIFAVFVAGAASPADDILDLGIGALMVHLLGWHWEFLPSFLAKLIPGVDLVPFWTWRWQMSIANRSKLPSGKKVVRNPSAEGLVGYPAALAVLHSSQGQTSRRKFQE